VCPPSADMSPTSYLLLYPALYFVDSTVCPPSADVRPTSDLLLYPALYFVDSTLRPPSAEATPTGQPLPTPKARYRSVRRRRSVGWLSAP